MHYACLCRILQAKLNVNLYVFLGEIFLKNWNNPKNPYVISDNFCPIPDCPKPIQSHLGEWKFDEKQQKKIFMIKLWRVFHHIVFGHWHHGNGIGRFH